MAALPGSNLGNNYRFGSDGYKRKAGVCPAGISRTLRERSLPRHDNPFQYVLPEIVMYGEKHDVVVLII